MSVELERVGWEDGTLVTPARVNVGGVTYDVTDAEYSGSTPLSSQNLKKMEENTENAINELEGNLTKNEYSTSGATGYNANYLNNKFIKMFNVNFSIGVLSPYQDKYDQTYTIPTTDVPANYTPLGIIGEQLYGGYFSHCSFTTLYVANRVINWGIKNNTDVATGSLGCNAKILAIKTSA
jgi:hypothetical protein